MLTVHRAERADVLADVLAAQLVTPLPDPMVPEIVAVPERGIERWLRQRLAGTLGAGPDGDGIAANISFDSPVRLLREVVIGTADDPDAARAWYTDRLRWPVLDVLDAHLDDPRLSVLHDHLGGGADTDPRSGRRLATASTLARLFSGYGWQRPTMLADWATGLDTDGAGRPLPEHLVWQAWFWRLVRDRIGQPHLAEQAGAVLERLRTDPSAVDLPERLAFFGPTRIPQSLRAVLDALAREREVSVFLPHPSDALWRAVAAAPADPAGPRDLERALRPSHPLLAALSRDVQELQQVMTPSIDRDVHHPADARPGTLLAALQAGLRADSLDEAIGTEADTSLEVHACHGPERQVEVLRDRLLHLFDDDPTLESRDVIVLCPDVEAFAPLIQGAFGQTGLEHPGFSLRVRLADRGLRETNEIFDVIGRVLDLAAGRVRSGDLLDLAGSPAVRRRFRFTDDDLDTVSGWVERSGIRWGIDATQRARFGLGGFPQGTASTGRDRVLLGTLAEETENQWLSVALPMDGIDSTDIDLAGRFTELVDRLGRLLTEMNGTHSARAWSDLLVTAIDALTEPDFDTQWQRAQAAGMLTEALDYPSAETVTLRLPDLRDLVASLLAARPTRSNFCTGELTVCTLVPMRSVPHRAVVLLGMDSASFPRAGGIDGDDILQQTPLIGERERRDEDRQTFLDAIGAATEHLLVFYTGADPTTGATVPPPVVVSELIESAGRVLGTDGAAVVHRHTLHAFDERNFRSEGTGPFSYDDRLLDGARALSVLNRTSDPVPPRAVPARVCLPGAATVDLDLEQLVAFFRSPTEQFLRQRLETSLPEAESAHPDQLDVELDHLEQWKIGDRYLRQLLAGADPAAVGAAEMRRGTLPPFALGEAGFRSIAERATAIGAVAQSHRAGDPEAIDVLVRIDEERRIYGTVGDAFAERLIPVGYSKIGVRQRVQAWIRLLAVAAGSGVRIDETVLIGAAPGREPGAALARLATPDDALEPLRTLVAVRDAGVRTPLWLPPDLAEAAASTYLTRRRVDSAMRRARQMYERSRFGDPYTGLVLYDDPMRRPSFAELIALGADVAADLDGVLPSLDGAPLFLRLAVAVYGPLLEAGGR
ncbi:MAG: exodeoxyribonuclease V subunit gamma [Gordonia sp. (in: high G+C Gram-positive bacteria)]|uniref:exodeoxyribonuclease V subunit gamma n=1 Tax=Gordonia sp. (in: high G+C Gram-positive bacteria) TaxID=84139 RepID=UPI0039E5D4D9